MDARTFSPGILADHASVRGFRLIASDGRSGRISWASYAPGESYLVVTTGLLRRRHRVLPAGAVTHVSDGEVRVAMSRSEIAALPLSRIRRRPSVMTPCSTCSTRLSARPRFLRAAASRTASPGPVLTDVGPT